MAKIFELLSLWFFLLLGSAKLRWICSNLQIFFCFSLSMYVSRKSEKRYMLLFLFCVLYSFKLVMCIELWFIQPIANFRLQHTCLLYRLATSLPWIGWTLVLFHFSISMTKRCDYADCDIGEDIISPFFSLSMLFSTLSFFPFSTCYFAFYGMPVFSNLVFRTISHV